MMKTQLILLTILASLPLYGNDIMKIIEMQKELAKNGKPDWWWSLNYGNSLIAEGDFAPLNGENKIVIFKEASVDQQGRQNGEKETNVGFMKRSLLIDRIHYTGPSILTSGQFRHLEKLGANKINVVVWVKVHFVEGLWIDVYPVPSKKAIACLRWRSILGDAGLELDSVIVDVEKKDLALAIEQKRKLDRQWTELPGDWFQVDLIERPFQKLNRE